MSNSTNNTNKLDAIGSLLNLHMIWNLVHFYIF